MNVITRKAREAAMQRLFEMEMAGALGADPGGEAETAMNADQSIPETGAEPGESPAERRDAEQNASEVIVELRTDDDSQEVAELTDEDRDFVNWAADAMQNHAEDVDSAIEKSLLRWTLGRLARVDLAILRLAVLEMEYLKTPPKIAINEAVELAKKYSGDKAHQFVNGVLAGYLKGRSS